MDHTLESYLRDILYWIKRQARSKIMKERYRGEVLVMEEGELV